MRWTIVLAGAAMLAACGKSEEMADANAAATGFRPPSVTSRADFGGTVERRFHRLDKNGDDKLQADELPERLRRAIGRYDTDGDGALNSDEYGALMLKRFDRQDLNRDGTVTSEERAQAREQRGTRGHPE